MTVGPDDEGPSTTSGTQTPISSTPVKGSRIVELPALTSGQISAAPTQANYNALQNDVAALHATLASVLTYVDPAQDQGQGGVSGAPTYTGNLDEADSGQGPST